MHFKMNGKHWEIIFVDPFSEELVDRTGRLTLGTTDPVLGRVYISNELSGEFLVRVVKHELSHCVMVSYGLLDDIHKMVKPRYWIDAEEWICNFLADYGKEVWILTQRVIGAR